MNEGVEITASAKDPRRPINQYEYPAKEVSRLVGESQGLGEGRRGHWAAKDRGRGRDKGCERSGKRASRAHALFLVLVLGLLWVTRLALLLADLANDGSDCFHKHPHASVIQIFASDLYT